MAAVNLEAKLKMFSDHWSPKIVASFNSHDVMVVKVQGEFIWHSHPDTDDFFLTLEGNLTIQLRDGDVHLGPGDLYVVPKGVEHRPVAAEEVHLLLIEPAGTPNTGDVATATAKEIISPPGRRDRHHAPAFTEPRQGYDTPISSGPHSQVKSNNVTQTSGWKQTARYETNNVRNLA